MDKKQVDKRIIELNNNLTQMEELLYSVKSTEGVMVLRIIENSLRYHEELLKKTCLQPLAGPYYEYEKNDLQTMKALRAKIDVLQELKDKFNVERLTQDVADLRNKVQVVAAGEPLEPAY